MSDSTPQTLDDPEFGPINLVGTDEGVLERRATFGQQEVEVRVEYADDSYTLTDVQRQAVRSALNLSPDVLVRSAPAVVQNYEVYREAMGDDEMPPLANPADVWDEVEMSYVSVPPQDEGTRPGFLLFAECSWDPEHGLVVRFRDGVGDASNQQGELGLDD